MLAGFLSGATRMAGRPPSLLLKSVLCTANSVLDFTLHLVRLAFCFGFRIAGDFADRFLGLALHVVGGAFQTILVHNELSFKFRAQKHAVENGRFQVAFQLGGKVSLGFPLLEPRSVGCTPPPEAPRRGNSGAMASNGSRRSWERVGPNIGSAPRRYPSGARCD